MTTDVRVLARLGALEDETAVTSVSVGELLVGVRALPMGRRRAGLLDAIETTLRTFAGSVLAYDEAAARHYAHLQEQRRAAGRALTVEDGMIAATSLAHGAVLATRNTADLAGLGVELIDPWAVDD